MSPRVLVAGIGNIFLGDDAFGVEVARRLAALGLPEGARVVDFGIRGLDLSYALLDGYESVIFVDAAPRGGRPGTLYVLELPRGDPDASGDGVLVEGHNLDPARVLRLATALGARVGRLILVGCEPNPIDESADFGAGLSPAALAAVAEAVPLIEALVARLLRGEEIAAGGDGTISGKEASPCCN
ncbi:MAG TPA: hydrogenase maturation protease [Isosphaeraceae bacterium]|jgi:hydrogenase maturation protease|nr:hydrogenase maturation protease [Isosphaeraceae bacterium]